jgi:hypothetical protein
LLVGVGLLAAKLMIQVGDDEAAPAAAADCGGRS